MDAKLLKVGCLVEVTAYGGKTLKRRIVEIIGDTVYICTDEEWNEAKEQRRDPLCVGFNLRFIIRRLQSEKASGL